MKTPPLARPVVGMLSLAFIAAVIAVDLLRAEPVDPFAVPPPVALGSGVAPAGAHCSAG